MRANPVYMLWCQERKNAGVFTPSKNTLFPDRPYEGGHRVPFIATWPRHIPENQESKSLLGLVDMTATMAVLLGQTPPPDAVDSVNALPAMLSVSPAQPVREWLIFANSADRLSLHFNKWKYLESGKNGELYNLETDPVEAKNIAESNPELTAKLCGMLKKERQRTPIIPVAKEPLPF